MSSSALTAGIAELLALSCQQRQEALNTLSTYMTQPPAAESNDSFFLAPPPGLEVMARDRYFDGGDLQKFNSRRGSVASTRVSGSSADSADSVDWSDGASEASGPAPIRTPGAAMAAALKPSGAACRSTLKLANIPRRCGKEELLGAIEAVGFADAYDFFYLPLGPQSKKNHGYAFINFKSNELADQFSAVFVGYPIRAKLLDVAPAPLQGLSANMEHFSKTQATKGGWMPNVVLKV